MVSCSFAYITLNGGLFNAEYETYKVLDDYEINSVGKIEVTYFSGTVKGNVEIISSTDDIHSIKIKGRRNGKYEFTIADEDYNEYSFEYYYDEKEQTVVLNKK